ncbi:MAG: hypothetical protein ACR2FY_07440 [Pirellulaceae bacterium]
MLPRIRDYVANDDWKKEGFSDKALEAWLDKLIADLAKATEDKELALPVRFADGKPAAEGARPRNALLFTKGGEVHGHVQSSIIFCDGNIKVPFAFNSVIVARGVVYVAHAQECVIISGSFVHVSHCDTGRRAAAAGGAVGGAGPRRSIALSRGMTDLSHATTCVLFAPLGIEVGHAEGCAFINHAAPDARGIPGRQANVRVAMPIPPLETIQLHPLGKQVDFLGVLDSDKGAVIRFEGKRYVAEQDAEIVDEAGKPVEKLAGWRLAFVNSSVLVFGRGGIDTAIVSRQRR